MNYIMPSDNEGFIPSSMKNNFINDGGKRVCAHKDWKWLEFAFKTKSTTKHEWYPLPEKFKPGSLFRITVQDILGDGDEQDHRLIDFNLYKQRKEDKTEETIASQTSNQYFVYPIPEDNEHIIGAYGILKWEKLNADTDKSITPDAFDEYVEMFALAKVLEKQQKFSEASALRKDVYANLDNLEDEDNDDTPAGYAGKIQNSRSNQYYPYNRRNYGR